MKMSLLLAFCFVTAVAGLAQRPCPPGWAQRDQHCYQLFDKHMHFHTGPAHYLSGRFCNDMGAHLAEITSEEENNFVKAWLSRKIFRNDTAGVWIGGKIPHGSDDWVWATSNESFNFTDWADPQDTHSGHCLSMSPKSGYSWVPEDCSKTKDMKYVCEQYLCRLATRCFQGSCYSLHCGTYRAKTAKSERYHRVDGQNSPCPEHGHLAQIESREESDFIKSFLDDADDMVRTVWTGGYEEDFDVWKWIQSGEAISAFTDWAQEDDFEDDFFFDDICIGLSRADGWTWRKMECGSLRPVLCERPDTSSRG